MYENIQTNINMNMMKISNLKDLDSSDFREKYGATKLNLEINNLDYLKDFYDSGIIDIPGLHLTLEFTKQIFLVLNINEIIEKSLLKSIDRQEMRIIIKLFTMSKPTDSIKSNNLRVIDRMNYIDGNINLHNKNHEILYHANQILKAYGKSEKEFKIVKEKINEVNNLVSKY